METWQLQNARAHFSEVFDRALEVGPQRVTRHGKAAVIIVSEDEWRQRTEGQGRFGDLLAECPLDPEDLPARRPARVIDGSDTD